MAESQFIIRLSGLPVGSHLYEFEVDNTFFESREYSEVEGGKFDVKLELIKQNHLITLIFNIEGTANVACDRCTKPYDVEVNAREEMFLKFGDPDEEHPENVLVLPNGANELDISQPLYEFISLALPYRNVPCEEDETFECDEETLKKLNEVSTDEPEQNPGESIWEKLKNINNN
ncbi:MAG: YceD family protein [Bacteroidia bacterium]